MKNKIIINKTLVAFVTFMASNVFLYSQSGTNIVLAANQSSGLPKQPKTNWVQIPEEQIENLEVRLESKNVESLKIQTSKSDLESFEDKKNSGIPQEDYRLSVSANYKQPETRPNTSNTSKSNIEEPKNVGTKPAEIEAEKEPAKPIEEPKNAEIPAPKTENKQIDGELQAIEVKAYRFGDSILDVPVNLTQITSKDIANSGNTSIVEVLQREANINFRSSNANPMQGEISMRGFGESSFQRVLVIVDGQRLNSPDMAQLNWSQLPLENIENIEILRGAQSAIYGNYAVSGVVKITTKKPELGFHGSTGGMYGSFGEENAYARSSYATEDYYVSANGDYYRYGGYRDFSESESNSAGCALGYTIDKFNEISMSVNLTEEYRQNPTPASSYDAMKLDPRKATLNFVNWANYGNFAFDWKNSTEVGEGNFQIGANTRDVRTTWNFGWMEPSSRNNQWTLSFTPRYRYFLGDNKKTYIEGGVDYYHDDMTSKNYNDPLRMALAYDSKASRETIGPWANFKWKINDTFSTNVAGRYEVARTSVDHRDLASALNNYDVSKTQSGASAQFGVNATIDENTNAYFRFDQLYRYPAIDELANFYTFGPNDNFNFDLKPEKGQNLEIGANYVDEKWNASGSFFSTFMQDEIAYDPNYFGIGNGKNINIGETFRYGADIRLGYKITKYLGLNTAWTFVDAQFTNGSYKNNDIPLVPNVYSTSEIWTKPIPDLKLALFYNWTSTQYMGGDFTNDSGRMPSFGTFDFKISYKCCEYATIWASIDNIGDICHASNAYISKSPWGNYETWSAAAGRSLRIGVSVKF